MRRVSRLRALSRHAHTGRRSRSQTRTPGLAARNTGASRSALVGERPAARGRDLAHCCPCCSSRSARACSSSVGTASATVSLSGTAPSKKGQSVSWKINASKWRRGSRTREVPGRAVGLPLRSCCACSHDLRSCLPGARAAPVRTLTWTNMSV